MGWTFYTEQRQLTYTEERAEIERLCTFNSDVRSTSLINASKVGTTWYAALRIENMDGSAVHDSSYIPNSDGSICIAAVFLTGYSEGGWGYKDMEETMGPNEAKAPLGLLDLLSELKDPDSYAHAWRKRCRDWAEVPEYQVGDKIRLAAPVTLSDGSTCQTLTVSQYQRGQQQRRCYVAEETGTRVRLPKDCLVGSELVQAAMARQSPVLAEYLAGPPD